MTLIRLCVTFGILLSTSAAFGARKTISMPLQVPANRSAGVAPSLPDVPETTIPGTQIPFYLMNLGEINLPSTPDSSVTDLDESNFGVPAANVTNRQ